MPDFSWTAGGQVWPAPDHPAVHRPVLCEWNYLHSLTILRIMGGFQVKFQQT